MHAFLIVGGTTEKRQTWIDNKLKVWKVGTFDKRELHPEEASIGISHIREFQRSLIMGPTAAIIWQTERLTSEAQNALLKTLEEPPRHTRIILETASVDVLLPTIISRCTVTNLGTSTTSSLAEQRNWLKEWKELATYSIGKQLTSVDTIAATRLDAEHWVSCGIETLDQQIMTIQPDTIRRLLLARTQLAANVTPKLVIDLLILGQNLVDE